MVRIDIEALKTTFNNYASEVNTTLEAVGHKLEEGDYVAACETLNTLTERMAKTSVSMRSILIKGKYIPT